MIALERQDRAVLSLLEAMRILDRKVIIPAGALAQAWRGSARQHRLVRLLAAPEVGIRAFDLSQALAAGALLAARGGSDVIDASVVVTAQEGQQSVVTSDAADLRRLDPDLPIIEV